MACPKKPSRKHQLQKVDYIADKQIANEWSSHHQKQHFLVPSLNLPKIGDKHSVSMTNVISLTLMKSGNLATNQVPMHKGLYK